MPDESAPRVPVASVVIPAHDEAAVIDRCLSTLLANAGDGEFEVLVVCNACTDDTAERAAAYPGVEVLSIPTPSKQAALQVADDHAEVFPRIYLDADIQLSTAAARGLAERLGDPDVEAAAPRLHYDLRDRPWTLRTYLGLVERLPVYGEGYVGSGVYALSRAGRERFGTWPRDLPDDTLVHRIVPDEHRVTTDDGFVVVPSQDLRQHLRRSVRIQRLNRALEKRPDLPVQPPSSRSTVAFLRSELRSPRSWPGIVLFAAGAVITRVRSWAMDRRGAPSDWMRDDSTRTTGTATGADTRAPGS